MKIVSPFSASQHTFERSTLKDQLERVLLHAYDRLHGLNNQNSQSSRNSWHYFDEAETQRSDRVE